jgi:hypothetical protein
MSFVEAFGSPVPNRYQLPLCELFEKNTPMSVATTSPLLSI